MRKNILFIFAVFLIGGCSSVATSEKNQNRGYSKNSLSCGSGFECYSAGSESAGRGDYKSAARYFEKACSYGISEACNNLAFQYANAEGVKQSYTLAYRYWGMACRMGNSSACSNLQLAKDKVEQMRRARR